MRLLRALRRLLGRRPAEPVSGEQRVERLIQSGIAANKLPPR